MSDNILKQLYKNTETVSKDLKSVETTLGKILKLEKEQEKFDKKREKDRKKAKNDEAREEKRKKADFQGFKGIVKMKKSEKDKEKKGLFDMLLGGIGGAVKNVMGGITSTLQTVVGGIGTAITGALGGLGLGAMLTSAIGALAGPLTIALGAAAVAAVMHPDVQKWMDKHIGDQLAKLGLGNWFGNQREEQGLSVAEAESISNGTIRRRGESSQATQEDKDRLATVNSITHLRRRMAKLDSDMTRYEQMVQNHNGQIVTATAKGDTQSVEYAQKEILKYEKLLNDHQAEYRSHQAKIQDLIISNGLEATYSAVGWQRRQTGGHINVPGVGDGDKVPMMLPQGSFVLNKMASMHFQTGGMVPTLLEPGEKVFMPGDWDSSIEQLNSMIPRFQTGGYVGAPRSSMVDTGEVDAKQRAVLLSPAAAAAWEKMLAAGMPYNPSEIANVYRDAAEYNRLIKAGYGAAANSAHNHGEAADIHGEMNKWIRANGAQYGWVANDYPGSHGGHFEFKGAGAGTGPTITGELEAAMESGADTMGNIFGGLGDAMGGFMDGLGALGEGFKEGFMGTIDKSNPLFGMLDGIMGLGGSIGNLFDSGLDFLTGATGANASSLTPGSTPALGNPAATSISDPNARALLNAIADAEGTSGYPNSGYNTMFTGRQFKGSKHPRQMNSSNGYSSDAAGRYQFLSTTWDGTGGGDMTPANQDRAALKLVSGRKVNIADGLSLAEIYRLGGEWASIEGGPSMKKGGSYGGQAKYSAEQFLQMYQGHGGTVQKKQVGGRVGRSTSDLQKRLVEAQASHSAAMQISVKPIVVYEDEAPPAVAVSGGMDLMPPELPDGPGSDMAADYFFNLALGVQ